MLKREHLSDLWDSIRRTNIRLIRDPEQETVKGAESLLDNFPNLEAELDIQLQEANNYLNTKKTSSKTHDNKIAKNQR